MVAPPVGPQALTPYIEAVVPQIVNTGRENANPLGRNTTDVVYQEVKLYIEGVQVPYSFISISQAFGQLPTCEFSVPPSSGLMDITRYYQPKVHVFFTGDNTGQAGERLLFWGHIVASSYQRTRRGNGSASIMFRCRHKNSVLRQITLDFGSSMRPDTSTDNNPNTVAVPSMYFNTRGAIALAMAGVTGVAGEKDILDVSAPREQLVSADTSKLSPMFGPCYPRLIGMPGVLVNLWNQVKRRVCLTPQYNMTMLGLLIPLLECGVAYIQRLSGHYLLELKQDNDRVAACNTPNDVTGGTPKIVPPAFRSMSYSAIHTLVASEAMSAASAFSNEHTDFISLIEGFYQSCDYTMLTLASPAELPVDPEEASAAGYNPDVNNVGKRELSAVETIVAPQIPFYFSPLCNVIYPRMFDTLSVTQEEEEVPTRIKSSQSSFPAIMENGRNMTANFRGPHSVREAESLGWKLAKELNSSSSQSTQPAQGKDSQTYDLMSTCGNSFNVPSKYEQGRGLYAMRIQLPWWTQALVCNASAGSGQGETAEFFPTAGTQAASDAWLLFSEWASRYGVDFKTQDGAFIKVRNKDKDTLNPYSPDAKVPPWARNLFAALDYEFSKKIAWSRAGSIECVFNPYIIPGYPMDILDDSPNMPSFHAFCTSVTHSITDSSISTSVGFSSATTYAEMTNYYTPPLHPWLETALEVISSDQPPPYSGEVSNVASTLWNNPKAKAKADEFYKSVLGVGAASPSDLYDFRTGQAIPQVRIGGCVSPSSTNSRISTDNGGDANPWNTSMGNLYLVSRPIEGKVSISNKFRYVFIDMTLNNYSGVTVEYAHPFLGDASLREPGASLFLDYMETEDFITNVVSGIKKGYAATNQTALGEAMKNSSSGSTTKTNTAN
jgi:hypothetical protein